MNGTYYMTENHTDCPLHKLLTLNWACIEAMLSVSPSENLHFGFRKIHNTLLALACK